MILSCNHISKEFVTGKVLEDCSFHIEAGEKAAIIGANGAGKSTLLKIIINEISADDGTISIAKDKTIGYLAQYQNINSKNTIYDEVLSVKRHLLDMETRIRNMEKSMKTLSGNDLNSLLESYTRLSHDFELKNGYAYKSEVCGVLKGLGFDENDFNKEVSSLSGGQKTRVALAKLLLTNADIILLDEPTNHLDMKSILWLENYLLNYKGAVIVVSHDRYFLDKIVSKVIEIENCHSTVFFGNYTDFSKKKNELLQSKINAYIKQQKEIKHQEEVISTLRSYKQEKFYKRAESREKSLKSMDLIENPETINSTMHITLEPRLASGNDVLNISDLSKQFNGQFLFQDICFDIRRGEKVAIIGNNGTGKTTILKIINNIINPDKGTIKLGTNVNIGYYDQEQHTLDDDKTLFDEISDAYPSLTNTQIRNTLAAFMFTQDDVFKLISSLSGGEKGRASLAKLMLSKANFIILDEPTNHLDILSKQILENALSDYTGTVLFVSHDRYFINKVATRIIELKNHKIINYLGNYDYYLEKCSELSNIFAPENSSCINNETSSGTARDDWKSMKEEKARIRKLENKISELEQLISDNEAAIIQLDEELNNPQIATNAGKLAEICREKDNIKLKLDNLYSEWEKTSEELV
ncbi:MAG: ABC-F family ATP-binding cassette domain-containing protein [Eubacterium sp.]